MCLKKKKKEIKKTLFPSELSKTFTKNTPVFFGKKVLYKIIHDGEPVWYERIVTEVLDDDEADQECK